MNTKHTPSIITKIATVIGLTLGAFALMAAAQTAGVWNTPPPPGPPQNNVAAPINVGLNSQAKLGQLFVNTDLANPYAVGLSVFGKSIFNGQVQITSGTPGENKVLTSDAAGNASWQFPGGSSAQVSGVRVYDSNGSFVVPAGVTKVNVEVWGSGGTARAGSYAYRHQLDVTPGATQFITIGNSGTASWFGVSKALAPVMAEGGDAAGGRGDIIINGGGSATDSNGQPVIGGSAPRGGAGAAYTGTSITNPGYDYCSAPVAPGGSGISVCDSPVSARGGAPGRVIVWW